MKFRKTLAEALVLSKLNYCNIVYAQVPKYLQDRLQRVQTCAAGYVLGRYAKLTDVIDLNWLPIKENVDFCFAKHTFQAIKSNDWPNYLPIETVVVKNQRTLRSNESGLKVQYGELNTFQNQAYTLFNDLPKSTRSCEKFTKFYSEAKRFYKDKALARVLSL